MNEIKLPVDKHDENVTRVTTDQVYTRSADTTTNDIPKEQNAPNISGQSDTRSASKSMSPGLSRALVGGLIGVTLGTLAGAFANRKTGKAINHAAKGVSDGVKTVGEGVNHAAKGVSGAVKSVAEGVNYAVVGAVDSLKDAAEDVEQSTVGAVDSLKDATEDVKQSAVDAFDAPKNTETKLSETQNQVEQRLDASKNQLTNDNSNIGDQVETQPTEVIVLVETGSLVVDETNPLDADTLALDAETLAFLGEVSFSETGTERPESY
ncbi:MAG: hypothetical protein KME05_18000 [Gloeocapsa sp. UFS-A4-WI-NPMV-4B04]|jgi:gas vesicle protein|nr:hypothetical protein [Gloeocapsa sp. UFS-A4-WI-NPMV-4B04]